MAETMAPTPRYPLSNSICAGQSWGSMGYVHTLDLSIVLISWLLCQFQQNQTNIVKVGVVSAEVVGLASRWKNHPIHSKLYILALLSLTSVPSFIKSRPKLASLVYHSG